MLITRVPASYLRSKRIDPEYYRPQYLKDEKLLLSQPYDEIGRTGKFFAGPFGSKLPSILYHDVGVPLFRVGNVGSMEVLMNNMAHLDASLHEELSSSEVVPGDLLIVKASVGEKICRVPSWIKRANITQHIIAVRPNGKADMDYIAAFLFGCYGRRQLERRSLGSIIQYLGVVDAKDVLYPAIGDKAQVYIGDKVRQAEVLRESARRLDEEMRSMCMVGAISEAVDAKPSKWSRVQGSAAKNRLDPKYYEARAMAIETASRENGSQSIGMLNPTMNSGLEYRDFSETGRPYITVSEVSSGRLILDKSPRMPWDVIVPKKAIPSSRCLLVIRSGSIGTCAKVHEEDATACISSDLIRLEFADEATAAAVGAFLNGPAGGLLLHKVSYGAVQPHLGQDELQELPIPNSVLDQRERILSAMNAREDCLRTSSRLTTSAKYLVESLIDGKVSEAELVLAQEALERHDRGPDRALLARLTAQGMDVPGAKPLFPDLDKLYELLDQSDGDNPNGAAQGT